eukprot:6596246-Pyramimonas_sp.AAC.1
MKAAIRAARRAATSKPENRHHFLCRGLQGKWAPLWMKERPPSESLFHAQWAACPCASAREPRPISPRSPPASRMRSPCRAS